MQEHASDAYAFLAVMCLPLVGWVLSRPALWRRIRPRLEPLAVRLWQQLVEKEQPDEGLLQRWAVSRLESLRGHLERVRVLISNDEWMTATRQTANRLAYEHLVRDVRDAEVAAAVFGPVEAWLAPVAAAPLTPRVAPRFASTSSAARSTTEVIQFGPRGRWI